MTPEISHTFALSGLTNAFEMLRVSAALNIGHRWRAVHYEPNVGAFEAQHGAEKRRDVYNARQIQRAIRSGKPQRGEHAGLSDCFVPVVSKGRVLGVLVAGPFETRRPMLRDVLQRWRSLTGRQAHLADPEFADYVSVTLTTLVLEGKRGEMFERFLVHVSALIAGEGDAPSLLAEAEKLRDKLEESRLADRTWEAARSMLDERTEHGWHRPDRRYALSTMGLSRPPDAVAVGLFVNEQGQSDPVEDLLRLEGLQRSGMQLLRERGDAVSCKVGDHGIAVLSAKSGTMTRKRERLLELGEQLRKLARRSGFELYLGLCSHPTSERLSSQYQGALVSAQAALSRGERFADLQPDSAPRSVAVAELCSELSKLVEEKPLALPARFDRYMEAVAQHCAYRLDPARAHLESSYQRLAFTLRDGGTLDPKSALELCRDVTAHAREAQNIRELFTLYRRAIADLSQAAESPGAAHQERSLRRAVDYIHEHFTQPLTLAKVSRIAGFAPNYFSRLFKSRERMTFAHYLRKLRIDRAKHLLETEELEVRRVARLAGFETVTHFSTVFKAVVGSTPLAYRQQPVQIKKRKPNI